MSRSVRDLMVRDFTNSLHNYRRDPSPDNLRALMRAGDVVCTHLVRVSELLELEREKVAPPRELCTCGGTFKRNVLRIPHRGIEGVTTNTEQCDACDVWRQTTIFTVGSAVDAG